MLIFLKFVIMFPIVYGILKLNKLYLCSEKISKKFIKFKYYLLLLIIVIVIMIMIEIFKIANLPDLSIIMEAIGIGIAASMIPYKDVKLE